MRYCIVRHVGFLIGKGRPAGDADALPHTVDQVIALLSRPLPDVEATSAILERLCSHNEPLPLPAPGSPAEADLFDALTLIFVEPARSSRAREAVRAAVGDATFETLAAYLAFIRTAHFWTETHPEIACEEDMLALMEERADLRALLLDPADAERVKTRHDLRAVLGELHQTEAALRDSQARLQVVVAELQHRARNLIAVVHALADFTLRSSKTLEEFRGAFTHRLTALARTQVLLSRLSDGERVAFDELIRTELTALGAPEDGVRVTLAGPSGVQLRTTTVQTLALAIHELATNAMKYGALGQPGARLAVQWRVDRSEEEPWLHVEWQESGVAMPAPSSRPAKGGNGQILIERMLPYQLGARTSLTFGPDGVRCLFSMPISRFTTA